MTTPTHGQFGYELTDEGRFAYFSSIYTIYFLDIKRYWEKTQAINWNDVEVLPESFRLDYINNQFEKDYKSRNHEETEYIEGEDYRVENEIYYWKDQDHISYYLVTQEVVNKMNLTEACIYTVDEHFEDEEEGLENWKEIGLISHAEYTHVIQVDRCTGVSKTCDENGWKHASSKTPHGETTSNEFSAWWNDLPVKFFSLPEESVFCMD